MKLSRVLVAWALFWGSLLATQALAESMSDRLETAATSFPMAEKSLFIDMHRAGNRLVAVGERGNIIYSDDGESWIQARVPISSLLTAVYFVDEQYGWAVGHGGIVLKTEDGGETWAKKFDGHEANRLLFAGLQRTYSALKEQFDSADEYERGDLEYQLEDTEFALSDAKLDMDLGPTKPLLDVWFKTREEGYVIGAYGFFYKTEDGGETWISLANKLENLDRFHLNAMTRLHNGVLMIVGEAGILFGSYDDGESWETLFGPYEGSFFGLQATQDSDSILVYGLRGHVFKSDDSGESWDRIDVPVETTITSSSMNEKGTILLAGHSGVLLESRDNGASFELKKHDRFEAHNAVIFGREDQIALAGEHGIQIVKN